MLDATTSFIVDLFVLLAAAVLAGEVASHLGQAALVGQLLAGIVLGPSLLGPYFGLTGLSPALAAVQTLAVIFILFMAGLEIVPSSITEMELGNLLLGLGVFVVPFTVGAEVVGPVLHVGYPTNLYVALTLSITALPVMGIMLSELGLARTRLGTWLMNAALVNELTAVSVFAVLLRLGSSPLSNDLAILTAVVALALFIATFLTIHQALDLLRRTPAWGRMSTWFAKTWRGKQGEFALLMVLVVGATLYSQFLGLTYVVGAFYAGLLVTRESAGKELHRSLSRTFDTMTWGFFIPLFFAFVGAGMDLRALDQPYLVLAFAALLAFAAITKIGTGAGIAAAFGWKRSDALAIGHLVNSRGAVELAMAVILLQAGLITVAIFTLIAAIGLVTTILSPIGAVRALLSDPERREALYRHLPSLRPGLGRARFRPLSPSLEPDWIGGENGAFVPEKAAALLEAMESPAPPRVHFPLAPPEDPAPSGPPPLPERKKRPAK
jgi:Kef-type K+ transport system membrane component KefB